MPKRYDSIARGKAIPDSVEPATERATRLRNYLERFESVQETKFVEDGRYDSPEVIATVVEDDKGPGGTTNSELWDASNEIRRKLLDLWAGYSATYTRRADDDEPPEGTVYKGYTLVELWDDPDPDECPTDRLTWYHKVVFRHEWGRPDSLYGSSGKFDGIDSRDDSTLLLDDVPDDVSPAVEWDDVIAVGLKDTRNLVCRGPAFEEVAEKYDDRLDEQHRIQYGTR